MSRARAPNRYTSATSTSGSSPTVAEKLGDALHLETINECETSPLQRSGVLPILPAALTLEPVLVLLAVGHGGAFKGLARI